jgi:hypothetical protein
MKTTHAILGAVAAALVAMGLSVGAAEAQRPGMPPAGRPSVSYDGGRTWVTPGDSGAFGPRIRNYNPPRDNTPSISDGEVTLKHTRDGFMHSNNGGRTFTPYTRPRCA